MGTIVTALLVQQMKLGNLFWMWTHYSQCIHMKNDFNRLAHSVNGNQTYNLRYILNPRGQFQLLVDTCNLRVTI